MLKVSKHRIAKIGMLTEKASMPNSYSELEYYLFI